MAIEKVLVVDDEMIMRNFLAETLKRKGLEVVTAENGKTGIAEFKQNSFDMVFTDMKMPDITGLEVLKRIKEISPTTIVVVVTAFGSIDNAVEAMRLGAFNYLIKPFTPDTIEAIIEKAADHESLVAENQYLRQQVNGPSAYDSAIVAENPMMKKILQDVERIANSNANVFISGESGTGKEVIARLIHNQSPRSQKPYVRVNCAAIPEALVESEFFGHEKEPSPVQPISAKAVLNWLIQALCYSMRLLKFLYRYRRSYLELFRSRNLSVSAALNR